ncbi:MAG: DUF721 domain-containing protein [Alphaproteobacteria bacterium]|nr:DUF721 domain-containing protein [Alphaproteobacteria bacterium]
MAKQPKQGPTPIAEPKRRGGGPRAIGLAVTSLVRPILGKRGFTEAAVITHWEAIVGPQMAAWTCPIKVMYQRGERSHGILHLRVAGGAFATEILHREPILLERINGYFGYAAVARLKLIQGRLPARPRPAIKPLPPLARDQEAALTSSLDAVGDDALRESLLRLGRAVLAPR